jgi:hypothetical protein
MNAMDRSVPTDLHTDPAFREQLFNFFLETLTGAELGNWLKDIGQDTRGSVAERQARIREHGKYLTMPASEFPAQTETYLRPYSSGHLADLCADIGVSQEGNKDTLYRRIMREVHYHEGWLPRVNQASPNLSATLVMPFLAWFPITKNGDYEKNYYPVIHDALTEVFGGVVYDQQAIAHGTTLKIDFHVGDPQGIGVGIEVKMPTSNSEVQRALGQIDQYQRRYGSELILFVLLNNFLKPDGLHFFQEELKRKSVRAVFR